MDSLTEPPIRQHKNFIETCDALLKDLNAVANLKKQEDGKLNTHTVQNWTKSGGTHTDLLILKIMAFYSEALDLNDVSKKLNLPKRIPKSITITKSDPDWDITIEIPTISEMRANAQDNYTYLLKKLAN